MKRFCQMSRVMLGIALSCLPGIAGVVNAQVGTTYTFSQTTGTYTNITGATVIASSALGNMDEDVIGLTIPAFIYDGISYTQIYVSTNGFITFGNYMPDTYFYEPLSSADPYDGCISAFGVDLNQAQAAAGTRNISYVQTANEFVIQWQNVRRYAVAGERISFQIRLNYTDNSIRVVYGGSIIPGNDTFYPQVGLRGTDNTFPTNVNNREVLSTGSWAASTPGTSEFSTCIYDSNFPTVIPAAGTNYIWTAGADLLISQMTAPVNSGCYSANETVSFLIKNAGGTTIDFSATPATINASASGVNPTTFSPVIINSGTLAPGATQTVTITSTYNMVVSGNYDFTAQVSLAGDVHTNNDMASYTVTSNAPLINMAGSTDLCMGDTITLPDTITAIPYYSIFPSTAAAPIPDDDPVGVNSTINVTGTPFTASQVQVFINNLSHSYMADLTMILTAPDGSTSTLFLEEGAGDPNMIHTLFTDTAVTPIFAGIEPYTGSYQPETPLSALTGTANGTWTLNVADNYAFDSGVLNSWELRFSNANSIVSYSWSPATGLSATNVANPMAFPTSTTTYTVTATDESGCSSVDSITVNVNSIPVVTANASSSTVCEGSSVILYGTGASTYSWDNAVTDSVSFTPANTNTYHVTGTAANGCSATDSITVPVNPLPVVNAQASDVTVCQGSPVILYGTGADTYTWDNGVTDSVSFNATTTTLYQVTGTSNGCSDTDTITIHVQNAPAVSFNNSMDSICVNSGTIALNGASPAGGTFSGTGVSGTNFNPNNGVGSFQVTYQYTDGNGCSASAQDVIQVISCTGIENLAAMEYVIYPNPSNGIFYIQWNNPLTNTQLNVYNALGQKIVSQAVVSDITPVQLNVATGMYTVELTNGTLSSRKTVIIH